MLLGFAPLPSFSVETMLAAVAGTVRVCLQDAVLGLKAGIELQSSTYGFEDISKISAVSMDLSLIHISEPTRPY